MGDEFGHKGQQSSPMTWYDDDFYGGLHDLHMSEECIGLLRKLQCVNGLSEDLYKEKERVPNEFDELLKRGIHPVRDLGLDPEDVEMIKSKKNVQRKFFVKADGHDAGDSKQSTADMTFFVWKNISANIWTVISGLEEFKSKYMEGNRISTIKLFQLEFLVTDKPSISDQLFYRP